MNRRNSLIALSAAFALFTLAVPAGDAAAQGAKSLYGTWALVSSDTLDTAGKKTATFGDKPRGQLVFAANGRYSLTIVRAELPRFAADNRAKGTASENQAVVAGSLAHFGKYTADEKTFTYQIESSTYPNWTGTTQTRAFTVKGDQLSYTTQAGSAGGKVDLVWKRIK